MKFDDALLHAVAHCESRGIDDPFYLYCVLSDDVGADYAGKDAAKMLFEIDKRLQIVRNLAKNGETACIVSKAAYPAFKEQYPKKKFCDFIDDVFCILTHSPRKERQSLRVYVKVAKKGVGKKNSTGQAHPSAPASVPAPAVPGVYANISPNVPSKYRGLWLLLQAIKRK